MKKNGKIFFLFLSLTSCVLGGKSFQKSGYIQAAGAVGAIAGGVTGVVFKEIKVSLGSKMLGIANRKLSLLLNPQDFWGFQKSEDCGSSRIGYLYDELQLIVTKFQSKEDRIQAIQKKCALSYEDSVELLRLYNKYRLFNTLKQVSFGACLIGLAVASLAFNSLGMPNF